MSMMTMPPWQDAIDYLAKKQVMPKDQFLALPDEIRMRAFTVAGETDATVLQNTLDALTESFSKGESFAQFRQRVAGIQARYNDPDRDWHLRLIFNQNVRQAHAAGAYIQRQQTKGMFPYVEYHTGRNPRPAHLALNGKIFGVDDPFLLTHTPPWEFNCNCDLTPRTAAEAGIVAQEDQTKPLQAKRMLAQSPPALPAGSPPPSATAQSEAQTLQSMLERGHLPDPIRGAIHPVDVRPANEKPLGGGYTFRPDRLNQTVDLSRFEPALRALFSQDLARFGYSIQGDLAIPMAAPKGPIDLRGLSPDVMARLIAEFTAVGAGYVLSDDGLSLVPLAEAGGADAADRRMDRQDDGSTAPLKASNSSANGTSLAWRGRKGHVGRPAMPRRQSPFIAASVCKAGRGHMGAPPKCHMKARAA